ncbi:MAG TPA: thioredoxin domain-containing protein [Rhizomicrobium sp.]|nr:thioredoxin domain-containing protein [Rhizomicrobium sp.]
MSRNQVLLGIVVVALIALAGAAWYTLAGGGASNTGIATAGGANVAITADDHTLGDPKAKIVAIEYAAPMCPHCAHFNEEGIPDLKANYIDKGKVFYVFRVFPIGNADIGAESLARCLPADNYFAFIDQLYRNQANWDPEYGVQDAESGLVAQARIAGMSGDQAAACMHDKAKNDRATAVAKDAETRYGITGTPTFVINGEVQDAGAQWPQIKAKLDSLLAKK